MTFSLFVIIMVSKRLYPRYIFGGRRYSDNSIYDDFVVVYMTLSLFVIIIVPQSLKFW